MSKPHVRMKASEVLAQIQRAQYELEDATRLLEKCKKDEGRMIDLTDAYHHINRAQDAMLQCQDPLLRAVLFEGKL